MCVSLDTFTGKGCGAGGRGSVLIPGYPLTTNNGRFLQHPLFKADARSFEDESNLHLPPLAFVSPGLSLKF